ncbi:MAG TPA: glutamate racemase [Firmicutes bacterium]|nr:glutamate racemase [Bacillota bacterium]
MENAPIGVYDSGVGGLTVVREIQRLMPNEDIAYLGDTARVPYGDRTPAEIRQFACEITDFLLSKGVKLIVVACNTSSALALGFLRGRYALPFIGMIEPGAEAAGAATSSGRIGVIGTQGTIKSGAYSVAIRGKIPDAAIFEQACPLLVPLVEAGKAESAEAFEALMGYLKSMKQGNIDTLVLGCTHYPFLSKSIARIMGPGVTLVDPAEAVARKVHDTLRNLQLFNPNRERTGAFTIYSTGDPVSFSRVVSSLLGVDRHKIKVTRISLEKGRAAADD